MNLELLKDIVLILLLTEFRDLLETLLLSTSLLLYSFSFCCCSSCYLCGISGRRWYVVHICVQWLLPCAHAHQSILLCPPYWVTCVCSSSPKTQQTYLNNIKIITALFHKISVLFGISGDLLHVVWKDNFWNLRYWNWSKSSFTHYQTKLSVPVDIWFSIYFSVNWSWWNLQFMIFFILLTSLLASLLII